eukprot:gene7132-8788_t
MSCLYGMARFIRTRSDKRLTDPSSSSRMTAPMQNVSGSFFCIRAQAYV